MAIPAGWSTRTFFRLADTADVVIRSLTRDDESLTELFLRTVGGGRPPDALAQRRPAPLPALARGVRPARVASLAIARVGLRLMFRRKLFWVLYALA